MFLVITVCLDFRCGNFEIVVEGRGQSSLLFLCNEDMVTMKLTVRWGSSGDKPKIAEALIYSGINGFRSKEGQKQQHLAVLLRAR